MYRRKFRCLFYFMLLTKMVVAQTSNSQVYEGNKAYNKGAYQEAGKHYAEAFSKNQNREAEYNLGNALYQQNKFDSAKKYFGDVAATGVNTDLKASAFYNLGNSFMKEKKWEEAIKNYKESLKLKPENAAAKYNLEYAKKMILSQQGGGDKKKDEKQQEKQNKEQEQNKPEEKNENNQPPTSSPQKPKPLPSKLSKEQADQLLNALNQEEKKLHEKNERNKGMPMRLEKDW